MPLITRKKRVNTGWAIQAAEAGAFHSAGLKPQEIANQMGYGLPYTAILIDLYQGYKKFPSLTKINSIHRAQTELKRLRHNELLRQLGELP